MIRFISNWENCGVNMREKLISGKPSLIKEINRNLIIKLIIRSGEIGRADLAKLTGLSLPSVMRITDGMIQEGLLIEEGKGASSGGRKPVLLKLNKNALYIIGVEIALRTTIVLSDLSGEVMEKWESSATSEVAPLSMLERINTVVWQLLEKHQIPMDRFAGLGIGTPGMNFKYNQEQDFAITKGWEALDVKAWFEAHRKNTQYLIVTENVARTRTLNELWFGLGRELKSFLYVFVDKGVGCGFVHNDTILTGHHHVAGEFGHALIMPGGRPCYCGNKGCVEMYVSAGAIVREVKRVKEIAEVSYGFTEVMSDDSDPLIREIVQQAGEILGYSLANLININNPKAVILGGEVPRASRLLSATAIDTALQHVFSKNALSTPIYVSEIERENDCLGSVALVINSLFKSIEIN